jgi:hypothetical protein
MTQNLPITISIISLMISILNYVRTAHLQRQALIQPHFKKVWSSTSQDIDSSHRYWWNFEFKDLADQFISDSATISVMDPVASRYSPTFSMWMTLHRWATKYAAKHIAAGNVMIKETNSTTDFVRDYLDAEGDRTPEQVIDSSNARYRKMKFFKIILGPDAQTDSNAEVRDHDAFKQKYAGHKRRVLVALPVIAWLTRRVHHHQTFYDKVFPEKAR